MSTFSPIQPIQVAVDTLPPHEGQWQRIVARYHRPRVWKSAWQIANSVIPFLACWALAYRLLDHSVAAALLTCVLATGFLLRINIIQHDCGHASFFKSVAANHALGSLLGLITIIPYFQWRHNHAVHHASGGNLARRGVGDVWVMTIREYESATPRERLRYRIYRNPFVLFGLAPLGLFLVLFRFTERGNGRREKLSVYATNAAIVLAAVLFARYASLWKFVAIEGAIVWMDATVSVWLFYMQHQFEHTSWSEGDQWDFATGALEGASWYKLPKILQWFSGNIGIHHIHHLSPKIPNYELQRCMDENSMFQHPSEITFWRGFRCASLRIWDEDSERLVTWREAYRIMERR
jgi:omega-6 fatty acid desaturase (delta-12 desaturase)